MIDVRGASAVARVGYGAGPFIRCDREGDHMDEIELNTVGRRAALRRIGGLTAAGVVGATAATLLPGGLVRARSAPLQGWSSTPSTRTAPSTPASRVRPDGLISGNTVQHAIWTDENGVAKIPETSGAVTYNLTATQTGGNGFLAIFPGGSTWGGISSINWTVSNADIANGGTVGLGPAQLTGPGSVHVHCGGFASTFFIIDVTGYYHTPA